MGNQQGNNFEASYYLEEDSGFEGSSSNSSSQNSSFESNNQHSFLNYLDSVKEPIDNSSFIDYSDENNNNNNNVFVVNKVSKKGVVKSKSIKENSLAIF